MDIIAAGLSCLNGMLIMSSPVIFEKSVYLIMKSVYFIMKSVYFIMKSVFYYVTTLLFAQACGIRRYMYITILSRCIIMSNLIKHCQFVRKRVFPEENTFYMAGGGMLRMRVYSVSTQVFLSHSGVCIRQLRRRGASWRLPAYHTPAGAFCFRTTLAASMSVTLCHYLLYCHLKSAVQRTHSGSLTCTTLLYKVQPLVSFRTPIRLYLNGIKVNVS